MGRIRATSPSEFQHRPGDDRDTLAQKLEIVRRVLATLAEEFTTYGKYTPVYTAVTNVDAVAAAGEAVWFKRGNTIYVQGACSVDPTSSALETLFRISLPVPTDIQASTQARGLASTSFSGGQTVGAILGSVSSDAVTVRYFPPTAGNVTHIYQFSYELT